MWEDLFIDKFFEGEDNFYELFKTRSEIKLMFSFVTNSLNWKLLRSSVF